MFPRIPPGTPPPVYSPPPPQYAEVDGALAGPAQDTLPQNRAPSPPTEQDPAIRASSPPLEELEIEAFGYPLARIITLPSQVPGPNHARSSSSTLSPAPTPTTSSNNTPILPPPVTTEVTSTPPATRRGRGRPRKAGPSPPGPIPPPPPPSSSPTTASTSTTPSPPSPPLCFDLIVHVLVPDKVSRTNRKTKSAKQEPLQFGPITMELPLAWGTFLNDIATIVHSQPNHLVTSSFTWRFHKPANSPIMPITSEAGLPALMRQVQPKVLKQEAVVVILRMNKPEVPSTLPWVSTSQSMVDEDEVSDDELGHVHKKGKLDDAIEALAMELETKYPPGLCSRHPGLACFAHAPTGLHFELTRPRRLAWAAAIHRDPSRKVSLTMIPIGSTFFKADQAIKGTQSPSTAAGPSAPLPSPLPDAGPLSLPPLSQGSPPPPSLPMPLYSPSPLPPTLLGASHMHATSPYLQPPFFGVSPPMPNPYTSPFAPNPYYQPNMSFPPLSSSQSVAMSVGANAWFSHATPARPPTPTSMFPHPASSPPPPESSVDDFYEKYNISNENQERLEALGFQIGDNLSLLSRDAIRDAGFRVLDWERIVKDYKKYMRR